MIIPTLNASGRIGALLETLGNQTLAASEIIVIDSSSDDDTVEIASGMGCRIEVVAREAFNHGSARNQAASIALGDILVFLSQDALPKDESFLGEITRPILEGKAVAVTARQIPYPGSSPLEQYARIANYPDESHYRDLSDVEDMGVMAYFFSNAASAVLKEAAAGIGGFPEDVVVNEDMLLCARLIHAGYTVAYNAEALVYHSHDYKLNERFSRYFDIGLFFDQAGDRLEVKNPVRRGVSFALGQLRYLIRTRKWAWIPASILESVLKFIAYQLGRRGHGLPTWLMRGLSRQKQYWDQPPKSSKPDV